MLPTVNSKCDSSLSCLILMTYPAKQTKASHLQCDDEIYILLSFTNLNAK
jgi:hypothetical protein